jgi:hypothetical protein
LGRSDFPEEISAFGTLAKEGSFLRIGALGELECQNVGRGGEWLGRCWRWHRSADLNLPPSSGEWRFYELFVSLAW